MKQNTSKSKNPNPWDYIVRLINDQAPLPPQESAHEYMLRRVGELAEESGNGVHARYSNLNEEFRKIFTEDPVTIQDELVAWGNLYSHPTRGGVMLYLEEPVDDPYTSNTDTDQFNYAAKQQWRNQWVNFVQREVGIDNQTRILFLAGFGDEIPLYLEAGAAPENLVAVERSPIAQAHLQNHYPGVQIVPELQEYLTTTDATFDAILLDYCGIFTAERVGHVQAAVARLAEIAALGVNFYNRDYSGGAHENYFDSLFIPLTESQCYRQGLWDAVTEEHLDNASKRRDDGITAILYRLLLGERAHQPSTSLYTALKKTIPASRQGLFTNLFTNFELLEDTMSRLEHAGIDPILGLTRWAYETNPSIPMRLERHSYAANKGNNQFLSDFLAIKRQPIISADIIRADVPSSCPELRTFLRGSGTIDQLIKAYPRLQQTPHFGQYVTAIAERTRHFYSDLFLNRLLPERRPVVQSINKQEEIEIARKIHGGVSQKKILAEHPQAKKEIPRIRKRFAEGKYDKLIGDKK